MNTTAYNSIIAGMVICLVCIVDTLAVSLYWQHTAIVHHAARFEVDSWGNTSFHWNDDSAQAPFINK